MLLTLALAAALGGPLPEVLARAIEHYRQVESYRVILHSSRVDGDESIRYFYMKPGFVRMEFIHPHAGAVLIYSPVTRRARLWPFGTNRFPELSLSPGNPLIRGAGGQQIDRSDVGALFDNIRALGAGGTTEIVGEASVDGRLALQIVITGTDPFAVDGVHRYELWLDRASQFPIKVVSRDQHDVEMETVTMEALEINIPLPATLFDPR